MNHRDPRHPSAGGAEEYLFQIAKRLAKRGHDVTVLAERPQGAPPQEEIDGVTVLRSGGFVTLHIYAPLYVKKHGRKYDVVVDNIAHVFPFLSSLFAKKTAAIIYHINGLVLLKTAPLPAALAGIIAEKITPRLYKTIITISPSTKDILLRLGARQVHVVPVAVDHQTYKPGSKSPIPLVVWINRFVPYKNPQDAVKIFAQVKKDVPEARFVYDRRRTSPRKNQKTSRQSCPVYRVHRPRIHRDEGQIAPRGMGVSLYLRCGGLRSRRTRGRRLRNTLCSLQRAWRQRRHNSPKNWAPSSPPRHKSRRGGPHRDPKKRPAPEKPGSSRPSICQPIQLGQICRKTRKYPKYFNH